MFCSEAARFLMYFMSFFFLDRIGTIAVYQQGTNAVTLEALEGSDIILPCSTSTKEDMVSGLFDWKKDDGVEVFMYDDGIHYNNGRPGQNDWFKGRVSHFADQLKVGNASIVIHNTKVNDSGSYRCIFPRLQPNEEKVITLVVNGGSLQDRTGENNGAAVKPIVGILNVTKDGVLLNCVVAGATSQPEVEWQDGDGNPLPAEEPQVSHRGDHYDVSVQITVTKTKTNHFYCVATQKNIRHVIWNEIHVPDQLFESCSSDVSLQIGLGFLNVVLGAVIVVCLLYIRHLRRKGTRQTDGVLESLKSENQC